MIEWNQGATDMSSFAASEVMVPGLSFVNDILTIDVMDRVRDALELCVATKDVVQDFTFVFYSKSGIAHELLVDIRPCFGADNSTVIGTLMTGEVLATLPVKWQK